jgi:ABC-type Fe3+-siderophore transport system permease subunit
MAGMHFGNPQLMAALTMQFQINWPRFIVAMAVFGALVVAGVYMEVSAARAKKKK